MDVECLLRRSTARLEIVYFARGAHISFLKVKDLAFTSKQSPHSHVKFALLKQNGLLDIFLNDEGLRSDNFKALRWLRR